MEVASITRSKKIQLQQEQKSICTLRHRNAFRTETGTEPEVWNAYRRNWTVWHLVLSSQKSMPKDMWSYYNFTSHYKLQKQCRSEPLELTHRKSPVALVHLQVWFRAHAILLMVYLSNHNLFQVYFTRSQHPLNSVYNNNKWNKEINMQQRNPYNRRHCTCLETSVRRSGEDLHCLLS